MKRILNATIVLTILVISILLINEYMYSLPYRLTYDYQSVKLDKGGTTATDLKELLIAESNKYNTDIIYQQRIVDDGADNYAIYRVKKCSGLNTDNKFNKISCDDFSRVDSSTLDKHELFIEKTDSYQQVINDIKSSGIKVKLLKQDKVFYTFDRFTIQLILILVFLNAIVVLLYHSTRLKNYSIQLLEGRGKLRILGAELKPQIKTLIIAIGIIWIGSILVFSPKLYYFKWWIICFIAYLIISVMFNGLAILVVFRNNYVGYLKSYNSNSQLVKLMLSFKLIALIGALVIIPSIFSMISSIEEDNQQIAKLAPYKDVVYSELYSSSIGISTDADEAETMDRILFDYYKATKDKFNGVLYEMINLSGGGGENVQATIDDKALSAMKLKDEHGNVITPSSLDDSKLTILISDDYKGTLDPNQLYYKFATGQSFPSSGLDDLGLGKKLVPTYIQYYPANYQYTDSSDLSSALSRNAYWLDVPGDDKFAQLEPYIEEIGGTGYIISAPSVTAGIEFTLASGITRLKYKLLDLAVYFLIVIALSIFVTIAYIKTNGKRIIVSMLEGKRIIFNLGLLIGVLLLELIIIVGLVLIGRASIVPSLAVLCIDGVVIYVFAVTNIKNKQIEFLKGDI